MTSRSTVDARLTAADLQQIDAICDRFEVDLRAGRQPDLTWYLPEAPPDGEAALFRELLNLELEYGQEIGEQPDARSYYQRFPELVEVIDAAFQARQLAARGGPSSDHDGESTVASPLVHAQVRNGNIAMGRVHSRRARRGRLWRATKSWASWGVGGWASSSKPTRSRSTGRSPSR